MTSTRNMLALFVTVLALPLSAFAQDNEVIDDIVVVGEKSLSQLRRDVYEAEEEFYALFNKLNDERDFDVRCRYERATGTNINFDDGDAGAVLLEAVLLLDSVHRLLSSIDVDLLGVMGEVKRLVVAIHFQANQVRTLREIRRRSVPDELFTAGALVHELERGGRFDTGLRDAVVGTMAPRLAVVL